MNKQGKLLLAVVAVIFAIGALYWGLSNAGIFGGPVVIKSDVQQDPLVAQDLRELRDLDDEKVKSEYLARRQAVHDAVRRGDDAALAKSEGALSRVLAEADRRKLALPAQ